MTVWKEGGDFKDLLNKDKDVRAYLSSKELDNCFTLSHTLKKVDYIFKRVFKKKSR
jgi:adenylosuccinate lyase